MKTLAQISCDEAGVIGRNASINDEYIPDHEMSCRCNMILELSDSSLFFSGFSGDEITCMRDYISSYR